MKKLPRYKLIKLFRQKLQSIFVYKIDVNKLVAMENKGFIKQVDAKWYESYKNTSDYYPLDTNKLDKHHLTWNGDLSFNDEGELVLELVGSSSSSRGFKNNNECEISYVCTNEAFDYFHSDVMFRLEQQAYEQMEEKKEEKMKNKVKKLAYGK